MCVLRADSGHKTTPQSGQQLYHSSTQLHHPPSQGEADYTPDPKPTQKQLL